MEWSGDKYNAPSFTIHTLSFSQRPITSSCPTLLLLLAIVSLLIKPCSLCCSPSFLLLSEDPKLRVLNPPALPLRSVPFSSVSLATASRWLGGGVRGTWKTAGAPEGL
jgi:hypothetical protein